MSILTAGPSPPDTDPDVATGDDTYRPWEPLPSPDAIAEADRKTSWTLWKALLLRAGLEWDQARDILNDLYRPSDALPSDPDPFPNATWRTLTVVQKYVLASAIIERIESGRSFLKHAEPES
jgi:hypothetical protein